jgi:hypothetical protein
MSVNGTTTPVLIRLCKLIPKTHPKALGRKDRKYGSTIGFVAEDLKVSLDDGNCGNINGR